MSRYLYGDLILEAFMEFRRPMSMDEVVEYVAEMTDSTYLQVRLPVDNTLTAAWMHGFVERNNDLYTLQLPDYAKEHRRHRNSLHLGRKRECSSFKQRRHCKRL
ncbi:uncharacterized protein LOC133848162 [Drosophila sulfurigaster albostrigata]|uniref:uncharacterized protein LOC133848162 n=1 Tax=Drosophila sulfurigaster albostrigata TaxID=89887 RepID=UPI002D21EDA4|nr:uncharacterized protein LOC133848162 [Drosophila sulfurigaster albostrigata]